MSAIGPIAEAVTRRFGLMTRSSWAIEIAAALEDIGRLRGHSPEQVSAAALREDEVLQEIAGRLTVVETYFLRHAEHFEVLVDFVRERLSAGARQRPLRVLSAGCGTGEEPYSMVISLLDEPRGRAAADVEVLATDIDDRAVAAARAGLYRDWSFRGLTRDFKARHFEPVADGRWRLADHIRARVSFSSEPILSYLGRQAAGSIDAIFFRNVSIYLEQHNFDEIVEGFYQVLAPGGLLVTSPADRVPAATLFERHADASISGYWRVAPGGQPSRPLPTPAATGAPSRTKRASTPTRGAVAARASERQPASPPVPSVDVQLRHIIELGDAADYASALALADALALREPANAAVFSLRGQLHFACGHIEQAVAELRRAVYLDGDDINVRLWLALSQHASGRVHKARLQLRELQRRLAAEPASGPEAEELRRVVTSMLES